MRLNSFALDNLTYTGKQKTVFDDQLPGFGVRVGKKAKTFVLMVGRERKLHSLGRYPAVSLKNARTATPRLNRKLSQVASSLALTRSPTWRR